METSEQKEKDILINNIPTISSPGGRIVGRVFQFNSSDAENSPTYSRIERKQIVEQLRVALTQFYVHLERKKLIYGFDSVRALELITSKLDVFSDNEFHQTIVQLIARMRDRHLAFSGKFPYGTSAGLPFRIEKCWNGEKPQYVVTKLQRNRSTKHLRVGAVITHWNGIPIQKYIILNANIFDGGNEAAAEARSVAMLTERCLRKFGPPIEEWVDLQFMLQGNLYEERFYWEGLDATVSLLPSIGRNLTGFGGDLDLLHALHATRLRFAIDSFDDVLSGATASNKGILQLIGKQKNFDYGIVTTHHGVFGYIRLWSFAADSVDDIANAFLLILPQLPKNGIVIDIRGNNGGYIAAGERILQLFTSKEITPSRFQFRVTQGTIDLVRTTNEFITWKTSCEEAFATGEPYSQGYAIEGTDGDANKIGQKYFGPVVILTDPLAFSTADIFMAGFIDHEIGKVICTEKNTAAAGGNNWTWDVVRLYNPNFSLNPALKYYFEKNEISAEVRQAFNHHGSSLSMDGTINKTNGEYDGEAWLIQDGPLTHIVRYLKWMQNPLQVYLHKSSLGLSNLPTDVKFGLTIRRCVRVGKNEGKVLEDLGILPDIIVHMTFSDITEKNQDLITRASMELSTMPTYDLNIQVDIKNDCFAITLSTTNINYVEVYSTDRYLNGCDCSLNFKKRR